MKFNVRKIAPYAIALVVILVLVKLAMVVFAGDPTQVRFAERSSSPTVVLKEDKFGEQVRLVEYAADKRTRVSMRIERYDGGSAKVDFSASGKATKLTEYYPLPVPQPSKNSSGAKAHDDASSIVDPLKQTLSNRTVLRETLFKSDGTSVAQQNTYRPDGSLKEVAVRTADDNLLVTAFRDDKNGVERIQVFDKNGGTLKNERVFYADGSVASLLGEDNSNYYSKAKQDFFGTDGKRTRTIQFTNYDVTTTDYAADGVTMKEQIQYSYGDIIVTAYDTTSGKKSLERRYNPTSHDIQVTFFNAAGTATVVQKWHALDRTTVAADQIGALNNGYWLTETQEMHPDGLVAKRIIRFYPAGKVVGQVELRPTTAWTNRTIKTYRPDGSLDNIKEYTWSQVTKTTVSPPGPNNDREVVPADLVRQTALLPGPAFDKSDMPKLAQRPLSYSFD